MKITKIKNITFEALSQFFQLTSFLLFLYFLIMSVCSSNYNFEAPSRIHFNFYLNYENIPIFAESQNFGISMTAWLSILSGLGIEDLFYLFILKQNWLTWAMAAEQQLKKAWWKMNEPWHVTFDEGYEHHLQQLSHKNFLSSNKNIQLKHILLQTAIKSHIAESIGSQIHVIMVIES